MSVVCACFFFNDTATTEIYTLSLHDALPILSLASAAGRPARRVLVLGGGDGLALREVLRHPGVEEVDRKSTRLNSSHANISYAVFCLKKKKESHDADATDLSYLDHLGMSARG